jgi:hypothetical protein
MTDDERMQRESSLIATIRKKLPEFAKACADETELMLLHQDAFAADYQEDEYALLGMAIKYAGLRGKEVRVVGKNMSTLGRKRKSSELNRTFNVQFVERDAQNGADAFVRYADFFTCVQNSITFPRFCGGTHATFL